MDKVLVLLGDIVGGVGILVCVLAGGSRLLGNHYFLGFETATLFLGSIALMVMACLVKLHQLTSNSV